MSHRKSNEGDLKIKYDYLYTLSAKISSEAKLIMAKRKHDPDRTALSYLQEPVRTDHEYVLDSDYSSSEEEDHISKKLESLNLDDLEEGDFVSLGDESLLEADNLESLSEDDDQGSPNEEDLAAMLD